jgi:hypothetical protein
VLHFLNFSIVAALLRDQMSAVRVLRVSMRLVRLSISFQFLPIRAESEDITKVSNSMFSHLIFMFFSGNFRLLLNNVTSNLNVKGIYARSFLFNEKHATL